MEIDGALLESCCRDVRACDAWVRRRTSAKSGIERPGPPTFEKLRERLGSIRTLPERAGERTDNGPGVDEIWGDDTRLDRCVEPMPRDDDPREKPLPDSDRDCGDGWIDRRDEDEGGVKDRDLEESWPEPCDRDVPRVDILDRDEALTRRDEGPTAIDDDRLLPPPR